MKEQVESCFQGPGGPGRLPTVNPQGARNVVGLVCPHAGYMYSGGVAAWAYDSLAEDGLPEVAVLIGPNHRSYFPAVALSDERAWSTPLGEVALDAEIATKIASLYPGAAVNPDAHSAEHSIEVQIPFMQYIYDDAGISLSIVPILVGASAWSAAADDAAQVARGLGGAIAKALGGKDVVVIASTDFTHYESGETARSKDSQAISKILTLDEEGLLGTVASLDISMCGAFPTAVTIAACRELGAVSARQLTYGNSGDVTGDYAEVVGYGALEIVKQEA